MKKTRERGTGNLLFILIVIGIVGVANLISVSLFGRIDLTSDGSYSLSKASREMVAGLSDRVTAKAYFSEDLPAPYNGHARYLMDQFEEYRAYGKGMFAYEFIDPAKEQIENDMMSLGIPPVQINEIRDDKFEMKKAYMGVVFYFKDKKETIPLIRSTEGLEYEITSLIKKLTSQKMRTVGHLTGKGTPDFNQELGRARGLLEKSYTLKPVELGPDKAIPDDIDTLLVINPTESFAPAELYALDQFLMKGKGVAVLLDGVTADLDQFTAVPNGTNLFGLLEKYGVTIAKDLVVDAQAQRINVSRRQGMWTVQNVVLYPYFPIVTDLSADSVITSKMEALTLPFVSSLSVEPKEGVTVETLARSSAQSQARSGQFNINPIEPGAPTGDERSGPFTLAVTLKGVLPSAYAGLEPTGELAFLAGSSGRLDKAAAETRLVVVGDGHFAADRFSDQTGAVLFSNIVDWLTQDDALIAIRSRGLTDRPLATISDGARNGLKYANIFGVPFLFVLFGLVRWRLRASARKNVHLDG